MGEIIYTIFMGIVWLFIIGIAVIFILMILGGILSIFDFSSPKTTKPSNSLKSVHDYSIESDKLKGKFMKIYKSKALGYYYPANEPNFSGDELVFKGTETECGAWLLKNKHRQPDFMK